MRPHFHLKDEYLRESLETQSQFQNGKEKGFGNLCFRLTCVLQDYDNSPPLTGVDFRFRSFPMSSESTGTYSRKNPFPSTLKVNRKLTSEGSEKDTRHFELDLAESGLAYEVGDSLGVFPNNDPALVIDLLNVAGLSGEESVTGSDGQPKTLRQALLTDFQITQPDKRLVKAVSEQDSSAEFLKDLLDPEVKSDLDRYLYGREVIDFLAEYTGAKFSAEELVAVLRKLQPRLYSIASSQRANPEEVHLTVATVTYESHGRPRKGVCSTFLAERASNPGDVPVFVHSAKHFRLPEDPATPVIMVGPGTGIAPFRAFLQDRRATGASGRNWLFFGEQRSRTDFLYQEEFELLQKDGLLTRFDTAFSRDQDYKIYVQHRIMEAAGELWKWLEEGAYFYVCGDAQRMASDVDKALHEAVQKAAGKTVEESKDYVDSLKAQKRYRKDVY
jgi:sulfite reductase (NADPH) flavoprotein alpha-component